MDLDIRILLGLQNFRNISGGVLTPFFEAMTFLAEAITTYSILFTVFWCFNKELGSKMFMSAGFSRAVNGAVKLTVCAYRPWIRSDLIKPVESAIGGATGYSFPSGHSTNAMVSFGSLGWHFRRHKGLMISCFFVVLMVLLSRIYVGVHTPQDVLCALLVTTVMIALSSVLYRWIHSGKNRDWIVLGGAVILSAIIVVWISNKSYPLDYNVAGKLIVDPLVMSKNTFSDLGIMLGILLGLTLENHFVRFTTDVPLSTKALRLISGLLVYFFLQTCLGGFLGMFIKSPHLVAFLKSMITYPFMLFVHPLMFTLWERAGNRIGKKA